MIAALMEAMPDGVIITDLEGNITDVNEAILRMNKRTREQIIGKFAADVFLRLEDKEKYMKHLPELLEKGYVKPFEGVGIAKDGTEIPTTTTLLLMRDAEGNPYRIVTIVRDLTELKHVDELIRSARMSAIGELASGVTHEIRNPLAIMATSVQYLDEKLALHDPKREFTKVINKNIKAIDTIVKRMLDFARPTPLRPQSTNINRLLEETYWLIKGKASMQRVKIIRQYTRRLPKIMADEKSLGEVFLNLMMNALQSMLKGGWLRINTDFHQKENLISIQFRDNGEGIPPDYQKQIFNPFFTTRKEGIGLGLSLSQRIINDHHGTIKVDSHVGKGTTFTIKLPVSP